MLRLWPKKKKPDPQDLDAAKIVNTAIRDEMTVSRDRLKHMIEEMTKRKTNA